MSRFLLRSTRLYEKLLFLYPEDLRREYGSEMILAFADDMEAAWGDARVAGVLQIWWYALCEIVTVALPAQTSNPSVLAPFLSFVLCACTQSAELWMGMHQAHHPDYLPLADVMLLVVAPSVLNASVTLIVTRLYARCSIVSLQLG
jgi:hypothetical protein